MTDKNKPAESTNEAREVDADLPLPVLAPDGGPEKPAKKKEPAASSRWQRLRGWYFGHKRVSVPLSIFALLLIFVALPASRYKVLGLMVAKNSYMQIVDSTTLAPVSGARVSFGATSATTDGNGKAKLHLPVGYHSMVISKKYYQDRRVNVLTPVLGKKDIPVITFQATGRQVKISVKNVVTKKALADVDIKVLDVNAKTDQNGSAFLVLPAGTASQKATLSLSGYNSSDVTVRVSDSLTAENEYAITPMGKVYFLSKLSGKIDLVKSNLDGDVRETVLAGTGREDNKNTVLLASRDWRFLALLSRRDSDLAKLYLIETNSDKVTAVDEGNATFSLIGWSDANFVYRVDRRGYDLWQPKQHALKSYNAETKKITTLDETDAQGSNNYNYNYESFDSTYLAGQRVVYVKAWFANYSGSAELSDNQLGIYSISASGSGTRSTHKTFGYQLDKSTYQESFLYRPDQVYFQVVEKSADPHYFVYANNQVSEKASIKDDLNNYLNGAQYSTYLQSPTTNSTLWSEVRDGKNSLFIGDLTGGNGKQIASLSDYQTYGWYTDNYILASKNGSELYIFGSDGIKKDSEALKITDYHRPFITYQGYGGGYGGL
ncbi:hypothetical protein BVY00_00345 [bacterium G20]|nr:hypothetical protein BVY00_00345 [bacterium G20]